ncbi:MAG: LTA synthase family protein [Sedimentisphaerales bacterium]|nr:LTA synthase family protein [Sedimentisphaerales bacterium]
MGRLYALLAPRAYTVLMFAALFCTLAVKLLQAYRMSLLGRNAGIEWSTYTRWILADLSFLLLAEIVLALICFKWPKKWAHRAATVTAAIICAWSVIHAGYLIRMGTEVLPRVLLPLVRDPINAWLMIGGNLVKAPLASILLLGPSMIALAFLCCVLAKPKIRLYDRKRFTVRIGVCLTIGLAATLARPFIGNGGTAYGRSPHVRAVASLFHPRLEESHRRLPHLDELRLQRRAGHADQNVVIVILEGVQYAYTSLTPAGRAATPYLAGMAEQGVEFENTRSSVTHTTKALFSLLTGRFPSASEDLAEAVPVAESYASLATILHRQAGYRTAFFQSAKGNFESRPGLIYNLGFEKFWARDDLGDPNHFIYYLACDEFAMIEPLAEWMQKDRQPFLLAILCSVTHDPYDVPLWYAERAKEPVERYRQTIEYTDGFLKELDAKLADLGLADNTILCVVGDHGEAFGEHGVSGHDQIAYEETLRIPFCMKSSLIAGRGKKIKKPTSSIDLAPTVLELLGFDTAAGRFDGLNALGAIPKDRKVYFCGWVREGLSGFVQGDRKYVYDPADQAVGYYDLVKDPMELAIVNLPQTDAEAIASRITKWRKDTIFQLDRKDRGEQTVFDHWLVWWRNRVFVRADYNGDA